jgi:DeoR family transcriptional regulator, suf operon transcriptional repressor
MLHVIGGRRQDILRLLLERKDGLTVDQIAAALSITRSAARDHVRSMERDELIAPSLTQTVTGGRPGTLYRLTDDGIALFPKNYDGLARLLLESLISRLGQAETEKELRALGKRLAADLKPRVGGGSLKDKAGKIANIMGELGFEATSSGDTIEAQNCIYHEMAQADPTVCTLDLALIGELADAKVDHKACMARGDSSCRFCLKK